MMIIENRWFALQGPRRVDLSGRPLGFLLVWFGGVGPMEDRARFEPHPYARQFGFFFGLPSRLSQILGRLRGIEFLEGIQLAESSVFFPHDWRKWPEPYRKSAEAAVQRAIAERAGVRLIEDKSFCDRRIDLAGQPLQLSRMIVLGPQ